MERDDLGGGGRGPAPWFPPSAPPLSPLSGEPGHAPWIQAPPAVHAPPPAFRQYPGVAYGAIGAPPAPPPPPFAFPGHFQAPRPPAGVYIAQRVGDPMPPRHVPIPHRRRGPRTQRHSYNLTWAFSVMARFMLLLLFDGANGVLGLCGAVIVWAGLLLSAASLPLCGFGIVLFHSLLRVACYLCQVDVVVHNAMTDPDHKITFETGPYFAGGDRESLLPTRLTVRRHGGAFDDWRLARYRFERTLYEPSPRSILAIIYFGTVKLALGVLSLAAVGLLLVDVGFLLGDKRVQIDIPHMDEHPLTVYLVSLAVLLAALMFVHGLAEISKRVTRFFCCEVDLGV